MPHSKGFVIGGSNCTFWIYNKNEKDMRNPYVKEDRRIYNKDPKFSNLFVNSFTLVNDDTIVCGVENGSLLEVPFSNEKQTPDEKFNFEDLIQPFHTQRITDFDICLRKPLIATCSYDKSVKIWNYLDYTLENSKEFDQTAQAISFHPSGFHVAVAFTDRVRMLNILYSEKKNDLRTAKDISQRGCQELAYSNGGHYLAIATGSIIQLYAVYSGECLQEFTMRGHTNGIRKIVWYQDDLGLFSSATDGLVLAWNLEDVVANNGKKPEEVLPLTTSYVTSLDFVVNEKGEKTVFTNSVDSNIYEINIRNAKNDQRDKDLGDAQKKWIVDTPKCLPTGAKIACLTLSKSKNYMFMGTEGPTNPGMIRCYKYPFQQAGVAQIQTHSIGVIKIIISNDDSYLFSIGEDCNLIVYELKDKDSKVKRDKESFGMLMSEEYLYDRDKYKRKQKTIEALNQKVKEMEADIDYRNKTATQLKLDKIGKLEGEREQQLSVNEQKMATISEEISEMEEQYDSLLETVRQRHEEKKMALEMEHKTKLVSEVKKYEDKLKEKVLADEQHKKFEEEIIQRHNEFVTKLREDYEAQLRQGELEREEIQMKKAELVEKFMKERDEVEEKAERDIEQLKETKEAEIKRMQEDKQTKQFGLQLASSECSLAEFKMKDKEARHKDIMDEITSIQDEISTFTKDQENNEKEIMERDKTIEKKIERINELKRKTQELEKFKFVLDYKIKELKRDIGPREEDIAKMKEQLNNMASEVEHFLRTNAH